MRIALAQTDCALGKVEDNLAAHRRRVAEAAGRGADVVVFPELSLHGYALGETGADASIPATDPRLAALSEGGPDIVAGFHEDARLRRHNAASYLSGGRVLHTHRKLYLPNYLGWEERKHAAPGHRMRAYDTPHGRAATLVCNDAWQPVMPWLAAQDGAEVLYVPANSAADAAPGAVDNAAYWHTLLVNIARLQQCWVVFVNRVGDEAGVRFWGGSRVLDPWGETVAEAPRDDEALTVVDIDPDAARRRRRELPLVEEARFALVGREVARLHAEVAD